MIPAPQRSDGVGGAVAQAESLDRKSSMERRIQRVAILLIFAACAATAFQRRLATWDDPYIYARVVRNVMDGSGWSYNPDRRLNPCTSPLYFSLLLGCTALVRNPAVGMAVLHALTLAGTASLLFVGLRRRAGVVMAAVVTLGFLHHPYVVSLNGVETLLLLLTTLAALYAYEGGWLHCSALLLSLAFLSRGDGLLLGLLVVAHYVISRRRFPPFTVAVSFLALPAVWCALHLRFFGTLLPQTLSAKIAQGRSGRWTPFKEGLWAVFGGGLSTTQQRLVIALACLAVAGLVIAWARRDAAAGLLGLFALAQFAAYSIMCVPFYHWYYGLQYLAVWYLGGLALSAGYRYAARGNWPRLEGGLAVVGWGAATAVVLSVADFRQPYRYVPKSLSQGYFDLADQVRPRLKHGERVLTVEVGALGWALPRQIVEDSVGLTGFVSADHVARGEFNAWLDRKDDLPDHVLMLDRFVSLAIIGDTAHVEDFNRWYAPVARFEPDDPAFHARLYERLRTPKAAEAVSDDFLLPHLDRQRLNPPMVALTHVEVEGLLQPALFEHPTNAVPIALTPHRRFLLFRYGLMPGVYDMSDGVRFRITISCDGTARLLFDQMVQPHSNAADRAWRKGCVDLGAFVGKQVVLTLSTDPGETPSFDQCAWVAPHMADDAEGAAPATARALP